MSDQTKIPEAIAHLDFDPDASTESDEPDLHECQLKNCTKVADWVGRMGCCKFDFYACDQCRDQVAKRGVLCRQDKCGKSREARWIVGWRRL